MAGYNSPTREVGYESLALCIVWQAITDYKEARRRGNLGQVIALERFFRSDWCCLLCKIDGEQLIEMAEKECARMDAERERKKHGRIRRKR